MKIILLVDLLFTAILYLFLPIIITFVFKKSFKKSVAFWISLGLFIIIKSLIAVLLNVEFNIYAAWWYLFIGQAILAYQHQDNETTRPTGNDFIDSLNNSSINHKDTNKIK